jgi:hypothetical protein
MYRRTLPRAERSRVKLRVDAKANPNALRLRTADYNDIRSGGS